jgi:hypothetical protein
LNFAGVNRHGRIVRRNCPSGFAAGITPNGVLTALTALVPVVCFGGLPGNPTR